MLFRRITRIIPRLKLIQFGLRQSGRRHGFLGVHHLINMGCMFFDGRLVIVRIVWPIAAITTATAMAWLTILIEPRTHDGMLKPGTGWFFTVQHGKNGSKQQRTYKKAFTFHIGKKTKKKWIFQKNYSNMLFHDKTAHADTAILNTFIKSSSTFTLLGQP